MISQVGKKIVPKTTVVPGRNTEITVTLTTDGRCTDNPVGLCWQDSAGLWTLTEITAEATTDSGIVGIARLDGIVCSPDEIVWTARWTDTDCGEAAEEDAVEVETSGDCAMAVLMDARAGLLELECHYQGTKYGPITLEVENSCCDDDYVSPSLSADLDEDEYVVSAEGGLSPFEWRVSTCPHDASMEVVEAEDGLSIRFSPDEDVVTCVVVEATDSCGNVARWCVEYEEEAATACEDADPFVVSPPSYEEVLFSLSGGVKFPDGKYRLHMQKKTISTERMVYWPSIRPTTSGSGFHFNTSYVGPDDMYYFVFLDACGNCVNWYYSVSGGWSESSAGCISGGGD